MEFSSFFPIPKPIITLWVIIGVIALLSFLATRNLKETPGPLQNIAEIVVARLKNFFSEIIGEKYARKYLPLFATEFIVIIVSNYTGLLPGAGEFFAVPTANLSVAAGLAIVTFVMTHALGNIERGPKGYLKSFLQPIAFMLPFTLIDQVVRPFSLALRLYGNMYAEETVVEQLRGIFPIGLPIVMMVLSLIFCLIQAMVFTMLSAVYIGEAMGED